MNQFTLVIRGFKVFFYFQEEKKILFYHPSDVEKNEKIRNVGLCEAIVQFTR